MAMDRAVWWLAVLLASGGGQAGASAAQVLVVFMAEPAANEGASAPAPSELADSGPSDALPRFAAVDDASRARYQEWLDNESAQRALDLFAIAWRIAERRRLVAGEPVYHVALVPDGNHADAGFVLDGAPAGHHRATPYIQLDPDPQSFGTTLLHETGHVVLGLLRAGEGLPVADLASVPHTTAALTDRGTAFNEGFAIHLETLAAHLAAEPGLRGRYQHHDVYAGEARMRSEFHRPVADLLTYAQSQARYHEVRENHFAFAPAHRGGNYLRSQLDKSRDFASLRDANQLLQSEGFYATFFFQYTVRGAGLPDRATVLARQQRLLELLALVLASGPVAEDTPYLLRLVERAIASDPAAAGEVVDLLLDASRGVFVDPQAAALWRAHYLGALRLDLAERDNQPLEQARARWRAAVLADPAVLRSRLGPQLRCLVASEQVVLVAFGEPQPLVFDLNTAEEGVLRSIGGLGDGEVARWLAQRSERPFGSVADWRARVPLHPEAAAKIDC